MATRPGHTYPFSAVVGQEQLKLALLLLAVDPSVGGALVTGQKGTAKSTAVRALAALLPDQAVVEGCRFGCDPATDADWCEECRERSAHGPLPAVTRRPPLVELPVSATEDRLLGTLDFEHALTTGKRRFEPGLLASANRGILYADEANLLDDHLVDALLDAAAGGVNTVEREGVAYSHPARFALVGTMNPEEGEVRPQLLDRFGLSVRVAGISDPDARVEIVRRRAAFDADPAGFAARFAPEDALIADRIAKARSSRPGVAIPDELLYLIAAICAELGVDGHRADIVIARAAASHAALDDRHEATADDVRAVAPLALAHRVRRGPAPATDAAESLARVVAAAMPAGGLAAGDAGAAFDHGDAAVAGPGTDDETEAPATSAATVALPDAVRDTIDHDAAGRRQPGADSPRHGRYVRSSTATPARLGDTALDATLRAAAAAGPTKTAGDGGPAVRVTTASLRSKVRSRRAGATIVLCVDASGSMGASGRMECAREAALDLLADAYERRDRVGLVAFRGDRAELVLSPTASVELARMRLAEVRTGGATPLAHALAMSLEVLEREKRRHDDTVPWLVLVTDGRANVGMGGSPGEDALEVAARLREAGVRTLVVELGAGPETPGLARDLADTAAGSYLRLRVADGAALAGSVRDRLAE